MKVTMPKNWKKWMTVHEAEKAREIIRDFKEIMDIMSDIQAAARVASRTNDEFEILKWSAEIAGNDRINDYHCAESGRLDVWVETYAFNSYSGFYSIGFYLTDIWALTGENREEIREHMFILEYLKNKH